MCLEKVVQKLELAVVLLVAVMLLVVWLSASFSLFIQGDHWSWKVLEFRKSFLEKSGHPVVI